METRTCPGWGTVFFLLSLKLIFSRWNNIGIDLGCKSRKKISSAEVSQMVAI